MQQTPKIEGKVKCRTKDLIYETEVHILQQSKSIRKRFSEGKDILAKYSFGNYFPTKKHFQDLKHKNLFYASLCS